LEKAFADLNNCGGQLGPSELRRLIWFNTLENIRSLVQSLDKQGVVDPTRVGIAGYSYGSQMVNVAVTQSHLFKAASSGDGNYLEPTLYRTVRCSYDAIYGGGPADAAAQTQYAAFAPSYRASFARTPVLQQLAEPRPGSIDFYQALRKAGVPAQLTLYPGESLASDETHFFHIPANQRAAMMENLAWFDFWLKGAVSSTESDDGQLARWMAMKMPDGEGRLIAQ
jgi:dipeptidyl aminopeptidase/acylaminoacyl peptidase